MHIMEVLQAVVAQEYSLEVFELVPIGCGQRPDFEFLDFVASEVDFHEVFESLVGFFRV